MLPNAKKNCSKKAKCLVERNCQVNHVGYKCGVKRALPKKAYLGLSEGEWKKYFYSLTSHKHKRLSFKHKRYSNKMTGSIFMWHKRGFK